MPLSPKDLDALARSLLADGPVKTLPAAPKRIRIRLGGRFVADTTAAVYVWEHAYYPTYYIPLSSFVAGALSKPGAGGDETEKKGYRLATLSAGAASTDRVIVFSSPGSDAKEKGVEEKGGAGEGGGKGTVLAGLVRVEFAAADAWFEEDARIDVHPKDPFKRVDVVFSSRPVRVLVGGAEVARAAGGCFHLYETGLPVRLYLPATSVPGEVLRESGTVTACPYKGEANYYDVVVPRDESSKGDGDGDGDGEVFRDLVWYYKNPKMECAAIAGCLCFYNEKVDIELGGEMLERPKTLFS